MRVPGHDARTVTPADERELITAAEARRLGIPRSQVTGRGFERAAYGLYALAGLDVSSVDARIAIAARRLPRGFVIGGWAAARLHEWRARRTSDHLVVFDGQLPEMDPQARVNLPILVCGGPSRRRRPSPGTVLFRSHLPDDEVTAVRGVPTTTALRTALDLARLWPTTPAVVALDRLRALGVVAASDLAEMVAQRRSFQGIEAARRALALSADGVESPRESMMRLLWLEAGLPQPLCNPTVQRSSGGFLGRLDLLDATAGLAAEYDGDHHAGAARRRDDAVRQEALEDAGLVVIRANDPDINSPAGRRLWQSRLRQAHARARTTDRPRRWVVA